LARCRRTPGISFGSVVVLPQDAVATESSTVASGADVVVDAAGHAYRAYLTEKGEKKVVVVRPDGVAGAIVRGAEGVKAYIEKIFVELLSLSFPPPPPLFFLSRSLSLFCTQPLSLSFMPAHIL
jgi:hypothetical protein